MDGDKLFGYHKLTPNVGVVGAFPVVGKNFYLNFELLFSQRGSRSTPGELGNDLNRNYILTLNYADVPIYLQYRDKDNKVRVGLGLSYGRLFSAYEQIDFKENADALSEYNKSDYCWLADLQYFVNKNIGIDFRFNYSIRYIRNFASWTYNGFSLINPYYGDNQFNHFLSFRAMYVFK